MSPEVTAAFIGVGVGGLLTIIGAVVGIVVERFARNIGEISCIPQNLWEPRIFPVYKGHGDFGQPPTIDPDQPPSYATYSFTLDLFNSKEIPVGLRSIEIVFECEKGSVVRSTPGGPGTLDPLILNLPPRQLVSQSFQGSIRGEEEVGKLAGWKRAKIIALHPGRRWFLPKQFSQGIARRQGQEPLQEEAGE